MSPVVSRRVFLVRGAQIALLAPVVACKGKPAACNDPSLAPEDAAARNAMTYTDKSPDPAKSCAKCRHYLAAPSSDACGTCKLLKGPIHPDGTCKVFSPS